jgi:hypothetical protein
MAPETTDISLPEIGYLSADELEELGKSVLAYALRRLTAMRTAQDTETAAPIAAHQDSI